MTSIKINEKYTVLHDNGVGLRAERYGEAWRDLTGDGLILAMAQRIEELEKIPAQSHATLKDLRAEWNDQDLSIPQSPFERIKWATRVATRMTELYNVLGGEATDPYS